jgi:hypothetical protein
VGCDRRGGSARPVDRLDPLDRLDRLGPLDRLDRLGPPDRLGPLDCVGPLDRFDRCDRFDRADRFDRLALRVFVGSGLRSFFWSSGRSVFPSFHCFGVLVNRSVTNDTMESTWILNCKH